MLQGIVGVQLGNPYQLRPMAAREKRRGFRLAAALFFVLLVPPWIGARQKPKISLARQWIKLTPEVAATHLIKKVAPVSPAFAKAAGIQEVSRVDVVIDPEGRTGGSGPATGWACLRQAAMTAAGQYVYRPFMKDGHPDGSSD